MSFLTILLPCLLLAQSSGSAEEFTLSGKVLGQDSGFINIKYLNALGKPIHDSCYLIKGQFSFKGAISEPTLATLYGMRRSRSVDDPNATEIYLEPGVMKVLLQHGNFKEGNVAGSKTQEEYAVYNRQVAAQRKRWKAVFDALERAQASNDTRSLDSIYNTQLPRFSAESQRLSLNFIKRFRQSYVSSSLLFYQTQRLPLDSLKLFYNLLSTVVQNARVGKEIKNFISKSEGLLIGKKAPDFTQTDSHGKSFSLSDFTGKYVLVDFWASWCLPCREEHPYLKQAYRKYKDKGFDIIGISLDRAEDKDKWLAAVEQDRLVWTQVCDFQVWGSPIVKQYNLQGKGIPANFLIGPGGEIMAKDLRGEQLEQKLATIFK